MRILLAVVLAICVTLVAGNSQFSSSVSNNAPLVNKVQLRVGDFIDGFYLNNGPLVGGPGGTLFPPFTWNSSYITEVHVQYADGIVTSIQFKDNDNVVQGAMGTLTGNHVRTNLRYTAPAGHGMTNAQATSRLYWGLHVLLSSFIPVWGPVASNEPAVTAPEPEISYPVVEPFSYPVVAPSPNATEPIMEPPASNCSDSVMIENPALIRNITTYQGDYIDAVQLNNGALFGQIGGGINRYTWNSTYITSVQVWVTYGFVNSLRFIDNHGNLQGRLGSVTNWPGTVSNITYFNAPAGYALIGANVSSQLNTDPYYGKILVDGFVPQWGPVWIEGNTTCPPTDDAPIVPEPITVIIENPAEPNVTEPYIAPEYVTAPIVVPTIEPTNDTAPTCAFWIINPDLVQNITIYQGDYVDAVRIDNGPIFGQIGGGMHNYFWLNQTFITQVQVWSSFGFVNSIRFINNHGVIQGRLGSVTRWPGVVSNITYYDAPAGYALVGANVSSQLNTDPYYGKILVDGFFPEWSPVWISDCPAPIVAEIPITPIFQEPTNITVPEPVVNTTEPIEVPEYIDVPVASPIAPPNYAPECSFEWILNPASIRNVTIYQGDYVDAVQLNNGPLFGQIGGGVHNYTWDESTVITQVQVWSSFGFVNSLRFIDNHNRTYGRLGSVTNWPGVVSNITYYYAPAGYSLSGANVSSQLNTDPYYGKIMVDGFIPQWSLTWINKCDLSPEIAPITVPPISAPCAINTPVRNITIYQGDYVDAVSVNGTLVGQLGGAFNRYTWDSNSYITSVSVYTSFGFINSLFFTDNWGVTQGKYGSVVYWPVTSNVTTYTAPAGYAMVGANIHASLNQDPYYGKILVDQFVPIFAPLNGTSCSTSNVAIIGTPNRLEGVTIPASGASHVTTSALVIVSALVMTLLL